MARAVEIRIARTAPVRPDVASPLIKSLIAFVIMIHGKRDIIDETMITAWLISAKNTAKIMVSSDTMTP